MVAEVGLHLDLVVTARRAVHRLGDDRHPPKMFLEQCVAVLALDLRRMGDSADAEGPRPDLDAPNPPLVVRAHHLVAIVGPVDAFSHPVEVAEQADVLETRIELSQPELAGQQASSPTRVDHPSRGGGVGTAAATVGEANDPVLVHLDVGHLGVLNDADTSPGREVGEKPVELGPLHVVRVVSPIGLRLGEVKNEGPIDLPVVYLDAGLVYEGAGGHIVADPLLSPELDHVRDQRLADVESPPVLSVDKQDRVATGAKVVGTDGAGGAGSDHDHVEALTGGFGRRSGSTGHCGLRHHGRFLSFVAGRIGGAGWTTPMERAGHPADAVPMAATPVAGLMQAPTMPIVHRTSQRLRPPRGSGAGVSRYGGPR